MSDLFERLSNRPVNIARPGGVPSIDFAAGREAARTSEAMARAFDRLSSFAFKKTNEANQLKASEAAAADPSGTLKHWKAKAVVHSLTLRRLPIALPSRFSVLRLRSRQGGQWVNLLLRQSRTKSHRQSSRTNWTRLLSDTLNPLTCSHQRRLLSCSCASMVSRTAIISTTPRITSNARGKLIEHWSDWPHPNHLGH